MQNAGRNLQESLHGFRMFLCQERDQAEHMATFIFGLHSLANLPAFAAEEMSW